MTEIFIWQQLFCCVTITVILVYMTIVLVDVKSVDHIGWNALYYYCYGKSVYAWLEIADYDMNACVYKAAACMHE